MPKDPPTGALQADGLGHKRGSRGASQRVPAGWVYDCRIVHRRPAGPRYRFAYRGYYLLLDLDRIDEAAAQCRLLSRNRFNLLAFYDRDHGNRDGGDLRAWAEGLLHGRGVDLAGGRIRLLCLPRVLGYVFNPISIYYCEHADGSLRAIICEVHNTFGEQHSYVLHRDGAAMDYRDPHRKAKVFHVSPLIERSGHYRFRFTPPEEAFSVGIRLFALAEDRQPKLTTALSGERRALTDRNLLALFLRIPLVTIKIVAAIHWQALKIWLRGARFVSKPAQRQPNIS